ncbi:MULTISPECIES: hypothetical protein [Anoxybacillaceae]|uniref:Uncharacterized protein n=1 Tax=Geobacillus kaustophilus (strain HTA426) TaxID=235909 RepID=Q5KV69_GEOKA|nr:MULTISPECIES: hypothetical protein [Bacillaceae]MED4971638.1 hypothetical protein [Geobacillus thermoleovorans]WJQ13755.1 hypothetical protein QT238_16855 [Geobacillus stearothermophilus]QCK81075.1 hypothetical protein E5Z46_01015 [Geobacillus kaustophilus NBRC 102445]RDE36282.1 hypothetical protein DV713_01480 [Parageobacillus thermoglucosidasius]BAD77417.1 hypothetical protein GK3132 [Geobacillus kaustophilus HTA426]
MSVSIGGVPVQGIIARIVQDNKEIAEQALNEMINKHKDDPARIIKEIQQPSPFSQFLDIKI